MQEQKQFLEILSEIKNIAASQDNQLTREEIKQYLSDMELSDDKLDAVCHYLAAMGIRICGMSEKTSHSLDSNKAFASLSMSNSDGINSIIKDFLIGDASARDRLAKGKLSHVIKLASSYKKREVVVNQVVSMDEIIAEGNVGLLVGISVIEKDKTQYFKSNGEPDYKTVNGIINMEIINAMENFIDMVSEDKDLESTVLAKINLLHEATKYLAEEYGRIPSKEELSEYTKVSAKEISDIMNLSEDTKRVATSKS